MYVITKDGTGLRLTDSSGVVWLFASPLVKAAPDAKALKFSYPGTKIIELYQAGQLLQLSVSEITSIGGVAVNQGTATLASVLDSLSALLATPSTSAVLVNTATASGHIAIQSAANGTSFAVYASQACRRLTVFNDTGIVIEVQQDGAGWAVQIPVNQNYTFQGLTNANQIGVHRGDNATTQIWIKARWEN